MPGHQHQYNPSPRMRYQPHSFSTTPQHLPIVRDGPSYMAYWHNTGGLIACLSTPHIRIDANLDDESHSEESLRMPRSLTEENVHYAFYPLEPLMGSLFSPINIHPHELKNIITQSPLKFFLLDPWILREWRDLEDLLKATGRALCRAYCISQSIDPRVLDDIRLPDIAQSVVRGSFQEVMESYRHAIRLFRLLSAYVSFSFSLWYDHNSFDPFREAHAILSASVPNYTFATSMLMQSSIVCRFTPGLRVGGFIDPYKTRLFKPLLKMTAAHVPIWLVWGKEPGICPLDEQMRLSFYPPPSVIKVARKRPLPGNYPAPLLSALLASYTTTASTTSSSSCSPTSSWFEPDIFKGCLTRESNICSMPPKKWPDIQERHAAYEVAAHQHIHACLEEYTTVQDLATQAMDHTLTPGMQVYFWRYTDDSQDYERCWIPPYAAQDVWDAPTTRVYWPHARQWDIVPCLQSMPSHAVTDRTTRLRYYTPSTIGSTNIPSIPQLLPDPLPQLSEYLRLRHGYQLDDRIPCKPGPFSNTPPLPVSRYFYRNSGEKVSRKAAEGLVDCVNVLLAPDVDRQFLTTRWDISSASSCFMHYQDWSLEFSIASDPNGVNVYLISSTVEHWKVVISSPTALLYIQRHSSWNSLRKIAIGLLNWSIPFRMVTKSNHDSFTPTRRPMLPIVPIVYHSSPLSTIRQWTNSLLAHTTRLKPYL